MSGSLRILRARDHARMPWKNGGGVTTEIAVHPPGAPLDAFDWRVSMADVAADGPFSEFPDVDRTLAVLDGHGLRLRIGHDRQMRTISPDTDPLTFPADVPTIAELTGGSIRDLNVMTRRGRWRHSVERLTVTHSTSLAMQAPVWLLLCHGGPAWIDTPLRTMELSPGDVLRGEGLVAGMTLREMTALFRIGLWPERHVENGSH